MPQIQSKFKFACKILGLTLILFGILMAVNAFGLYFDRIENPKMFQQTPGTSKENDGRVDNLKPVPPPEAKPNFGMGVFKSVLPLIFGTYLIAIDRRRSISTDPVQQREAEAAAPRFDIGCGDREESAESAFQLGLIPRELKDCQFFIDRCDTSILESPAFK